MFYIDHNATTPMCPQAIDAMAVTQKDVFGNASSVHAKGQAARSLLEAARASIAGMIGCKTGELHFTSGGTEANNWVCYGIPDEYGYRILVSATEHKSMLNAKEQYELTYRPPILRVCSRGVLDLGFLEGILEEEGDSSLVSVMLANNETGIIQPVREISEIVRKVRKVSAGVYNRSALHTDACQAFGKIPVNVDDLGVDLMSLSAHKLGGPKGIGALYIRESVDITAMILGGHQEHDKRAGTENVAAAVGFQVAAKHRLDTLKDYNRAVFKHAEELLTLLRRGLGEDVWVNGGGAPRIPNTLNVGFSGVDTDALVILLSNMGIAVSTGSACEAGRPEGSHVLKAMGQSNAESRSAIRFSFSDDLAEGAIPIIAGHVIESVKAIQDTEQILL